jgi:ribokinase
VRAAVIGHVEWIDFVRVESVPRPGEIIHASETWAEAAGGGAVAAVQLANLGCETLFFTALGDDDLGRTSRHELAAKGVDLHAAWVRQPQRRGITYLDDAGERTITVIGEKLRPRGDDESLPWEQLHQCDCVYFTGGDVQALRKARHARVLVATARELPTLRRAGVELDALVGSATDEGERYGSGDLDPAPRLFVATSGHLGGWAQPGGPFAAAVPPGPIEDAYGAGDCFAAGLTFALGRGDDPRDAVAFGALCGATVITGRGPYGRQLTG